ncbi:translation initiation factor IF-2 [Caldimonas brevitalea]|uniref:Translation initiation factor IF-2 n=2 Tax=Caldimonas brevitalea TaxID=413882 RepID=A0A0G3BIH1_9BURK|nr:translation initiation factor IF-2 [Caldimonas brevitalea]
MPRDQWISALRERGVDLDQLRQDLSQYMLQGTMKGDDFNKKYANALSTGSDGLHVEDLSKRKQFAQLAQELNKAKTA